MLLCYVQVLDAVKVYYERHRIWLLFGVWFEEKNRITSHYALEAEREISLASSLSLSYIKQTLLHCWFWNQCLLTIFPSHYLHFQKSIVTLRTTQVSQKPHICTTFLQLPVGNTLIWSLCNPSHFPFFFTLRSLETWHKNWLKFRIIAVFPFLTDWHFFNGSKFYYFHAFYYKLHSMISTKISHHLSF